MGLTRDLTSATLIAGAHNLVLWRDLIKNGSSCSVACQLPDAEPVCSDGLGGLPAGADPGAAQGVATLTFREVERVSPLQQRRRGYDMYLFTEAQGDFLENGIHDEWYN